MSVPLRLREDSVEMKKSSVHQRVNTCVWLGFTFGVVQLSVDLDEDAGVAAAHDQQRNHIQGHKMKHVVRRLVPALVKAAVCDALSEVHVLGFDRSEDEQLQEERRK